MIFSFGEYELDTKVYELRKAGRPCPVEPQVFDVLAYLIRHRDRLVTKAELLENLWADRFVSETTLTSRLKEARKAVGDSGSSQTVIRTSHGRGYRFVADVVEHEGPSDELPATPTPLGIMQPPRPPALPAESPEHEPPSIVGRDKQLAVLDAALAAALDGARRIVFLTGDAGAGKSTLVETFLHRSASRVTVARGQCVEHRGTGEAYMPLLDAIGRLCREDRSGHVLDVLRREAPSWLVQLPSLVTEEDLETLTTRAGTTGERMLREIGIALEHLTVESPLIVLLEDLHWSDFATLDVIDLLARHRTGRLLVIGTWRPSDVLASKHPVHALSQELRVRGLCEVVSLPMLEQSDLERYLAERFEGAPFAGAIAAILHRRTAGNPLFVRNLVDSWTNRNLIRKTASGWEIQTEPLVLETDVPDTLQHLIERQLNELDASQVRALETASVMGSTFDLASLAATIPAGEDDLEQDFELLARQGRFIRNAGMSTWGDGSFTARFAFSHDLYTDVIYDRIPAARRARLHRQVGLVLERAWTGREKEHANILAHHFFRARDAERGPRFLQAAAEQALARGAYREATTHLENALPLLDAAPPSPTRDRIELAIRCQLAPPLIATRGWADPQAEQNYLAARALAEKLGDRDLLSQALYGMANMYEYRGQYRTAETIIQQRVALDEPSSAGSSVESHELLACTMVHQGRYRESVEFGNKALADARGSTELNGEQKLVFVQVHGWVSAALFFSGRPDEARALSEEAVRLAGEEGSNLSICSAALQAAFLRFFNREPDRCRPLTETGLRIARAERFPFWVASGQILDGWCKSHENRHHESIRNVEAGIRSCRAIGALMDVPVFLAILAECQARAGKIREALASLDEAIAIVSADRGFFYAPELHRARGHLLMRPGADRASAIEAIRTALSLAEEQDSPVFVLRSLTSLAGVDPAPEHFERLRTICALSTQGRDTADMREALAVLERIEAQQDRGGRGG